MATKELSICLKDQNLFYPGDTIRGQIILDLRRSVDVQHISLAFYGSIEGCGEKIILINETQLLATPKGNKNYTNFGTGKVHEFDFSFMIPTDKKLPSTVNISKLGKITYMLTAIHKKPRFKLSPTLSSVSEEVKILDRIDINSPDYQNPVKATDDIGFINGSKLTQWSLNIPRSAFSQGDNITVDCQISNFPIMKRAQAIKLSLVRQIHKTSSAKVLENKTLSFKFVDLNVSDGYSSSQSIKCDLNIPPNTPPNIFPDTGRVLSVSYLIRADLNMKGVKSAIKIKPLYEQQVSIVIGTYTSNYGQMVTIDNNNFDTFTMNQPSNFHRDPSYPSLQNLLPLNHNQPPIMSPPPPPFPAFNDLPPSLYQNNETSNMTLPSIRRASGMGTVTHISPLSRFETFPELSRPKSYVPLKPHEDQIPHRASLPSRVSSDSSNGPITPTSHDFTPRIISKRHSFTHKSLSFDRSMTPLPPLPPMPLNHRKHIVHSVPHEIGPNDIITVSIPQEKVQDSPPELLRNDTLSTSSSSNNEEPTEIKPQHIRVQIK